VPQTNQKLYEKMEYVTMKLTDTKFSGLKLIYFFNPTDSRGKFVKFYNETAFKLNNLNFNLKEAYYSVSKKNVIRGMHFQISPMAHKKIVFVSNGKINDVVIDIRKNSPTFGQTYSVQLSSNNNLAIFIPKGFAHGFVSLADDTIVNYLQTTEYSQEHDQGILWNSFSFEWKTKNPILSERDNLLSTFEAYCKSNIEW